MRQQQHAGNTACALLHRKRNTTHRFRYIMEGTRYPGLLPLRELRLRYCYRLQISSFTRLFLRSVVLLQREFRLRIRQRAEERPLRRHKAREREYHSTQYPSASWRIPYHTRCPPSGIFHLAHQLRGRLQGSSAAIMRNTFCCRKGGVSRHPVRRARTARRGLCSSRGPA